MKPGELVVIVDSVEEAIKFYTRKLGFDLVDLQHNQDNKEMLESARLKKGKCSISFRQPHIEEQADFSFVKRCANRCISLHIEMKKGLDKFLQRCRKKGLEPKSSGHSFSIRDPFGVKLIFSETASHPSRHSFDFFGLTVKKSEVTPASADSIADKMAERLKGFGVLRRVSKKYAKHLIKEMFKS